MGIDAVPLGGAVLATVIWERATDVSDQPTSQGARLDLIARDASVDRSEDGPSIPDSGAFEYGVDGRIALRVGDEIWIPSLDAPDTVTIRTLGGNPMMLGGASVALYDSRQSKIVIGKYVPASRNVG